MRKVFRIRHHVAVTPFQRLLEDDWPAAAQLGELSPELERPEGEENRRSRPPRSLRCNEFGGWLRPGRRTQSPASSRPVRYATIPCATLNPPQICGSSSRCAISSAVRTSSAARRWPGPPAIETWLASKIRARRDPIGLSRSQRQQEASGLEVRRPDRVDDPQTVGRCPADVDPGQVLRGDLAGVAEAKMESTQADLDPIQDQGHDGAPGRGRKGHPDGFQDGTRAPRVPRRSGH